ncbi:c-type cytochrome [Novosphingobium rosa]|uniref:c-type cytochrome n=1 Tax=Novosphingobium rosa TaxID=76978 RepID=UPI0012EDED3A|nr:c-type cytochrome [Novosphingobium rosa]
MVTPAAVLLMIAGSLWWRHGVSARQIAMLRSDPEQVLADPVLRNHALADGRKVFLTHCTSCHGAAGKGDPSKAMPDLTDKDFLYGRGRVGEIEQIVLHGIRAGDSKGRDLAEMPGFAKAEPYTREKLPSLTPAQISDIVGFLRAANGNGGYDLARIGRGHKLFSTNGACWDCHASDGAGDAAVGAPNLIDGVWLKGNGSEADLTDIIEHGMAGISPAFQHSISAYDARAVAVYTASLHPSVRAPS